MLQVELPQIGLYAPVRSLGGGSTMLTHLYRHTQRKKYAVIKITRAPLVTLAENESFLNRARLLKKLKHRYFAEVLEFGMLQSGEPADDYGYLVTQYIEGGTMRERFAAGQPPPDEVRRVLTSLADTLQYAHAMFAIHGNLHPGNVLQTGKDFFLTDFSLLIPEPQPPVESAFQALLYRAPEHLRGGMATQLSDQYSLAVMTYEWLCGCRPYQAATQEELLFQQEHEPVPAPSSLNTRISPLIESTLLKALALEPAKRFPQTLTFAQSYLHALMGLPPTIQITSTPVGLPQSPVAPAPVRSREIRTATGPNELALPPAPVSSTPLGQTLPISQPVTRQPITRSHKETTRKEIVLPAGEQAVTTQPPVIRRVQKQGESPLLTQEKAPAEAVSPARSTLSHEQVELQHRVDSDLRQGGVLSTSLSGYEERPAQIEMATLIARALTENTPAVIEASTGTGKALDVDTALPTPTGWKRMGDLTPGDLVFDEQGMPTRVSAAFDVMYNRPCYEVLFSDGSALIADAEHEWASYTASSPAKQHREGPAYILVTTEQMAATLTVHTTGRTNHAIAVAGSLTLPDADLPLAPYFLGTWLGNETASTNQITSSEPEIIIGIENDGNSMRSFKKSTLYTVDDESSEARSKRQTGITGRLRILGVLHNKHIPGLYLRASEQQRRALLAGLLDTAGTVNYNGTVEFATTSSRLAEDVYELVCSLGFIPSLSQDLARYNERVCGSRWTLAFTTDMPIFHLECKIAVQKERLQNQSPESNCFRYVVAVRQVSSRPVRCIQVEAANHLYLAGRSMIPTHNSLSYLIPVVRSGKVAIISTANKALQEQLFFKDIPFVQKYIRHFDAALVKGMGNYICLDRMEQERAGIQHYVRNSDFMRLMEHIQESDEQFTGDFEMLGFTLPADIRSKVNADRDQCTWTKCTYYSDCYVRKMKARAGQARVIVVNHTLLLLDALMEGYLLPERDVIIVDEAHHLEEEATRAFTVTISQVQVATLLAQHMLKEHTPPALQEETKETMNLAWQRLYQVADPGNKGRSNLKEPLQEGLGLATVLSKLTDALCTGKPKDLPEKEEQLYDKLITRAQNLADNVRTVFSVNQPEKYVYYVEQSNTTGRRGIQQLEISAAPLEITSWLKEQLFDKSNVICTSATLATIGPDPAHPEVKGPNFAYFRRRVGLDYNSYPDVQERILPLTFDYQSKAILYLPRHLPEPAYGTGPAAQEYTKAIGREMIKLVEASRGRAFLLFSSKRMLEEVYEIFQSELPARSKFPLLRQGDSTRMELVRNFREREGAVLFGLKSFWEGVDIAGEALSLVVIDKLPFDPPDDPVHEARVAQMKAAGENWFGIYVLPQTVLRLKQGLGRLLRTHDDRGVMAILDTRLYTKNYGKQIVQALPPARRTANLSNVEQFFNTEEDDDEAPF